MVLNIQINIPKTKKCCAVKKVIKIPTGASYGFEHKQNYLQAMKNMSVATKSKLLTFK